MRYPSLVAAAPLEVALAKLQADIATLRTVAPEAAVLPGFKRHSKALAQALEESSLPISRLETALVWARSHDKYKEFQGGAEEYLGTTLPPELQLSREDAA